jgi:hypothetical protein
MGAWTAFVIMVIFAIVTAIVAFLGGALKKGEE